jgi:hypothetical protein|tara:strand:+ start:96 stop:452 length:357 start_codon:yes stop_codon:yes gene_type:complete
MLENTIKMDIKNFILGNCSPNKNKLNSDYKTFMLNTINNCTDEHVERWENYNDIIDEVVRLGYDAEFEEIKYRITDSENPNEVLLDVFERIELSPILMFHSRHLEDYLEIDKYSKFFN